MNIPSRDAILALEELIEQKQLQADYLICCGDMADKANPTAMNYVWGKFHLLAEKLKVKNSFATVGNHDIDSRYAYNEFDAKGMLHGLNPPYPLPKKEQNYEFWTRNFVVLVEPLVRLVVLNSCAYHGVNPKPELPEYMHGRISTRTLDDLRRELGRNHDPKSINLLVCHHHPHKHLDIEPSDYSSMIGGEKLIDLLSSVGLGSWVVIHGHKHQPRLCWGAGGASPPLVFGAGSLSAKLYDELRDKARNQFYIITFLLDDATELALDIAGEVEVWDYVVGNGWSSARIGSGLPARAGFGYRPQLRTLARDLEGFILTNGPIVTWKELVSSRPGLRFLLPMDVESLRAELIRVGVKATVDENGMLIELVKST